MVLLWCFYGAFMVPVPLDQLDPQVLKETDRLMRLVAVRVRLGLGARG